MALTEAQVNGVIELFVRAFETGKDQTERRNILSTFEQSFRNSIPEWKDSCKKLMEKNRTDPFLREEFAELIERHKNSALEYEIRLLQKTDLEMAREIINKNFDMFLTHYDDEKFTPFIEDGCSFVACYDGEIFGVVLAYKIPSISCETIFIDTLVVAEGFRNKGLGRRLLQAVSKVCTDVNYVKLRLNTEKTRPAYEIYKHLGFAESKFVSMDSYFLNYDGRKY